MAVGVGVIPGLVGEEVELGVEVGLPEAGLEVGVGVGVGEISEVSNSI